MGSQPHSPTSRNSVSGLPILYLPKPPENRYSLQRRRTRSRSSSPGATVGGKRSPPHSSRRGNRHVFVASSSSRFQMPAPSSVIDRSSSGVLGSIGDPK